MNKNDLISQVADDAGLSKADATKAVDAVFDSISGVLSKGGEVRLVGFGTSPLPIARRRQAVTCARVKPFKSLLPNSPNSKPVKA